VNGGSVGPSTAEGFTPAGRPNKAAHYRAVLWLRIGALNRFSKAERARWVRASTARKSQFTISNWSQ